MVDMERPDRFEKEDVKETGGMMASLGNLWNSLTWRNQESDISDIDRQRSQDELRAMRRKLDSRK